MKQDNTKHGNYPLAVGSRDGLYYDQRLAGSPRFVLTNKPTTLMDIPPEIRKCVVFLGWRRDIGPYHFAGTAFYVGRHIEGTDKGFTYLITAKHVIDGIRDKGADKVCLRVNLKEDGARWVETEIGDWEFHPDELASEVVDVAVFRRAVPPVFDHRLLPISNFATDDYVAANVHIGHEVFLMGLFSNHSGRHRNIPIVRVGNLIAMREEHVETKLGPMDAYLIEARSFGGISGSPVFVRQQGFVTENTSAGARARLADSYSLLGLMHGHWDLPVGEISDSALDTKGEKDVNMGIAIVVPAPKILEVIDQPVTAKEEKKLKEELQKQSREQKLPKADSLEEPDTGTTKEGFENMLKHVSRKVQPESKDSDSE